MAKRRRVSTNRRPFASFIEAREPWDYETDLIADLGWDSPSAASFDLNWNGLLKDGPIIDGFTDYLMEVVKKSELSLVSVLIGCVVVLAYDMQAQASAPTFADVAAQLDEMVSTALRLMSLAQGSDASGPLLDAPFWMAECEGSNRDNNTLGVDRSLCLHPSLQDAIFIPLNGIPNEWDGKSDESYGEGLRRAVARQDSITGFFEDLASVIGYLIVAQRENQQLADEVGRARGRGAPAYVALDWALVKLLWIWRDVLGREISIYVRTIRDRLELPVPEPGETVAFVVAAVRCLQVFDPQDLTALEKRLNRVRKLVPTERLATLRSGQN